MSSRTSFKNSRSSFANRMSFEKSDSKGTKPTREASSIQEVMLTMVVHICKKSLFFDTNLKIALYLCFLFLLSLIADVMYFPKTYFSRSDNVFNLYFVKLGWFWTLLLTIPFTGMISFTICCGRVPKVLKGHMTRLVIATIFWYCWTTFFNFIEKSYGRCNAKSFGDKGSCLKNGYFWNGLDLSGHCFILIYSSLILIEEARAIVGWEQIKDYIREEEYTRSIDDKGPSSNPLKNTTAEEFTILKHCYAKYTPYVRGLFVAITLLQILWDIMLITTILYYHIMVEKFVSGVIAILTWYVTYRAWFTLPGVYPNLPGEGIFKYGERKFVNAQAPKRRLPNGKHFMGMPINVPGEPEPPAEPAC